MSMSISKRKILVLSRGAVRFYASIKVFLQMGGGSVIPPQIIDCKIPPRLTLYTFLIQIGNIFLLSLTKKRKTFFSAIQILNYIIEKISVYRLIMWNYMTLIQYTYIFELKFIYYCIFADCKEN